MPSVTVEKQVAAPAASVWAVLADFGGFLDWAAGGAGDGRAIRVTGDGVGMVRHLSLPGIGEMAERLDRLDHAGRTQVYTLVAGQPIGMARYSATVTVSEAPGGCRLHWTGTFEPAPGADPAAVAAALEGSYAGMSAALEAAARR
jgi:hypothetical protein